MKFAGTFSSTTLIINRWYEKNLRELPMRQTRDPYHTWVAEVILQQTRMDQGLPYVKSFLTAFPDLNSLASAQDDEVLRLWQGLGYYSRARNMLASARYISEELGGVMPGDYQGLLKLKGVGKYTAAAIASWCYNEACAAVDGNVARVLARLFGLEQAINTSAGEKELHLLATRILDRSDPGKHNQAMIEFGAIFCVPTTPPCEQCPLRESCEAYRQGRVDQLPVKVKSKKPVDRWFYYYMITSGEETILIRRGKKDIWQGLYELPLMETEGPKTEEEIVKQMLPLVLHESAPGYGKHQVDIGELSAPEKHQLSHQTIHARFLQVEVEQLPHPLPGKWQKVRLEHLDHFAKPRLIHRYLESSNF